MTMNHISDDWLVLYSVGFLDEPELGQTEEHLLICQGCRDRLVAFDEAWGPRSASRCRTGGEAPG